jgi:hypothetical protein
MSFDPATLVPGLIFGCIGMAYFSHGRKASRPLHIGCGLGLMILPYLIDAQAAQLTVCGVLAVLPFAARWL